MAKNETQQDAQRERGTRGPQPTHLIGRSRGTRPFNRAGLRFESTYQAWPLSELSPERVKRILNESMVEARLGDERDVEQLGIAQRAELDESVTKADLVAYIQRMEKQAEQDRARIEQLEQQLRSDRAPKNAGDIVPGR